ncbi:Endocytosis and vacuole integrity protein [Coemansia sp. RSA 988]|nr:Endocytosis and vacuole integrity protein [Coemansia sp. RSA 988]
MATTNISALLLSELQGLSTEARRKHPEIKEAAERVIVILRGIKATQSVEICSELAKHDEVVSPFVQGCKSNNHRLAAISVQCLQQLISHQAVSARSIGGLLGTLNTVIHMGVDVQVKILQMVLPLVTMYDGCVYGETLVEALHVCLALQRSKDPIVSNTAAAILRQVVIAVFDRVVLEDREHEGRRGSKDHVDADNQVDSEGREHEDDNPPNDDARDTREEDLTRTYSKDAFFVLQDLCLLAAGSDSIFIREADPVDQSLVMDLIESVLTNHAAVVARHTAMLQVLRERLAPFIVNFFAERAPFTLVVRSIRIAWLFIRDLHADLEPECELLLSVLTRLIDPGTGSAGKTMAAGSGGDRSRRGSINLLQRPVITQSSKTASANGFPLFYRVLAMEVVRKTLQDPALLCRLFTQFDGRSAGDGDKDEDSHAIADVLAAVARVALERPELRVSNADGIPSAVPSGESATDGGATADTRGTGQFGAHNSNLRTEMHRLLDKHDPPGVPETYLSFLGLTTVLSVVDGLAGRMLQLCTETAVCQTPHGKDEVGSELGPVLSPQQMAAAARSAQVVAAKGIVLLSWSGLLSVYTFYMAVRLDDQLFARAMDTARKVVQMSGAAGLVETRNAFLMLLCRNSLPQAAISEHERQHRPPTAATEGDGPGLPHTQTAALVTTSLAGVGFGMHGRQMECLRAVLKCAQYLAAELGAMWYPVLVTLQQAEELLYQSHGSVSSGSSSGTARRGSTAGRDDGTTGCQAVQRDCARLLGFARVCGPAAVTWAVRALCAVGADLSNVPLGLQVAASAEAEMRATPGLVHRRLGAALNRATFAVEQLRRFAVDNIDLLVCAAAGEPVDSIAHESDAVWSMVTRHLLASASYVHTPAPIRAQACDALADVVLAAMDLAAQADQPGPGEDVAVPPSQRFAAATKSGAAQVQILKPLLLMVTGAVVEQDPAESESAEFQRFVEVSHRALDTLHRLLQASGRSLQHAWDVVFDILRAVLDDAAEVPRTEPAAGAEARQPGFLMRCAFPCLQLICTDYLEDLPPHCLRRCIGALGLFGQQPEDLNISLTAIGQAWALCDYLRGVAGGGSADQQISNEAQDAPAELKPDAMVSALLAVVGCDDVGTADEALHSISSGWWDEALGRLQDGRTQQVLWILLLRTLAALGRDGRHEVRLGAAQTLFRTLDIHGAGFGAWLWDAVVWAAVLPLAAHTLARRGHVLGLIGAGQLDRLLNADVQDSAAQIASRSGVVAEDPARLLVRQWDETAATALLGAAHAWRAPAVWATPQAELAWLRVWHLVTAFFVGEPSGGSAVEGASLDILAGSAGLGTSILDIPAGSAGLDDSALDIPTGFVARLTEPHNSDSSEEAAVRRSKLRTRDSVTAAVECAVALVECAATTQRVRCWRVVWRAWVSMGALVTFVPALAASDFNADALGAAVVTPELLCAYLCMCPAIVQHLRAAEASCFSQTDAQTLRELARTVLMYSDLPLHAADDAKMTQLQAQVLDVVLLVRAEKPETATTAMLVEELAMLATLPYSLRGRQADGAAAQRAALGMLGDYGIVKKTTASFEQQIHRLDALAAAAGPAHKHMRRWVRPSFIALSAAALGHLGSVLCTGAARGSAEDGAGGAMAPNELAEGELARVLEEGVWQDAIVAMGLHVVDPPQTAGSDPAGDAQLWSCEGADRQPACWWFVRAVPSGMLRLRAAVVADGVAQARLAEAWAAVGAVLATTMCVPRAALDSATAGAAVAGERDADSGPLPRLADCVQICVLDAIAAASLRYVAGAGPLQQSPPPEVEPYWAELVRILEWGAQPAAEPVVLLDAGAAAAPELSLEAGEWPGATAAYANPQALTMACLKWLFRLSSATMRPELLPVPLSSPASGEDDDTVSTPAWVVAAAAPAMVRRCRAAIELFVSDQALLGASPMPLSRRALLQLVLDELAHLRCPPAALSELDRPGASVQCGIAGEAVHIFALYNCFLELLLVQDADVLRSIQLCLRRVSAELSK